jgi:hypothetical protein
VNFIAVRSWNKCGPAPITMRCPHCKAVGVLESSDDGQLQIDAGGEHFEVGSRSCPNPKCRGHIFTVWSYQADALVGSFPPETLEFDASNLPKAVLSALEEAVKCHASGCFRAAALMVRRTLEELCLDREAEGPNLKERLSALSDKVAVAASLVEGLDTLRLLGNDAAHVELKDFDSIGPAEAELAIEVTKELLKGVYQYEDLVARLASLKRSKGQG